MRDHSPYDLFGPLPEGTLVLEASAGTGKTHAIATLVTRFVAERDVPIEQQLMVTFGTAATQELRTRVFAHLRTIRDQLVGAKLGVAPTDPLASHLAQHDQDLHLARIEQALNDFDQATIATTHTFCAQMLDRLGIIADWDGGERFVTDLSELVEQVADDLYVQRFLADPNPGFSLSEARAIARASIEHLSPIYQAGRPGREDFANAVRTEFRARKARARVYTYDDLIDRMLDAIQRPATAAAARERLSAEFPIVLVDEFQDTDPQQWSILETAFRASSTMVLIGDPKQSIYGFRNADLATYLAAVGTAHQVCTLPKNWRSDPGVVSAVQHLFDGVPMGDPQVQVSDVASARQGERLRLAGNPVPPISIRCVEPSKDLPRSAIPGLVNADLISILTRLLADGTYRDDSGLVRQVAPSDIAILTRARDRAEGLRSALIAAGLPAVFPGATSVFASPAAADWAAVIDAWRRPGVHTTRRAALTDLVGTGLADLLRDPAGVVAEVSFRLQVAGASARRFGLAAGWRELREQFNVDARLLGRTDGSPILSDLAHAAELLIGAESRLRLDLDALAGWLMQQRLDASRASDAPEVARQLDTDSQAITVLTMHGAKGLEFPIVALPTTTSWLNAANRGPFVFTEEGRRMLYVGDATGRSGPRAANRADLQAEELRLLYVAMTRAKSAVVTWWYDDGDTADAALHRLLARQESEDFKATYPVSRPWRPVPDELISITKSATSVQPANTAQQPVARQLSAATFDRVIDQDWRRTSYSALTAAAHEFSEASGDEAELNAVGPTDPKLSEPVPLGSQPGGASFGSLVHLVLEYLDWSVSDLTAAVATTLDRELPRMPLQGVDAASLTTGLVAALRTPLGPLTDGRPLAELPVDRRLAELDFELPLGGESGATVGDLARLLAEHLDQADPLADYPNRLLESPAAEQVLRGFLTGSIDAVLEVDGRYVVVDYKTNRMPTSPDAPLTAGHYIRPGLAEAMMAAHYPLQALLYAVALHRYLAWRLPGYDPETHLGGVGYLFVRGMVGPDAPVVAGWPTGVFGWYPSHRLIVAASDLLGGRLA